MATKTRNAEPETSHEKGKSLEDAADEWMKTRGFRTEVRKPVRAGIRPQHLVDVKASRRNRWAYRTFFCAFAVAIAAPVLAFSLVKDDSPWGWLALGVMVTFFAITFTSGQFFITRVWVECKNHQTGVLLEHVLDLKWKVDDVRKHRPHLTDWKPTKVYLVSGTGFDPLALQVAHLYGFKCYALERGADGKPVFVPKRPPEGVE